MKTGFSGLVISLLVHGAVAGAAMCLSYGQSSREVAVALDDISFAAEPPSPPAPPVVQKPVLVHPPAPAPVSPVPKPEQPPVPASKVLEPVAAKPAVVPVPIVTRPQIQPQPAAVLVAAPQPVSPAPAVQAPSAPVVAAHSAPAPALAPAAESASVATVAESEYDTLSEIDYTRISSCLRRHMTYPYRARQKGWQGKVLVAFRLKTDGGVSDIRVAESSGCQFLDESAVATINRAAPFPSLGREAHLLLPVAYRLR